MFATLSGKSAIAKVALFAMLSGSGWLLQAADYDRARDLVSRVQNDLQRAEDFTLYTVRYSNRKPKLG